RIPLSMVAAPDPSPPAALRRFLVGSLDSSVPRYRMGELDRRGAPVCNESSKAPQGGSCRARQRLQSTPRLGTLFLAPTPSMAARRSLGLASPSPRRNARVR